MKTIKQKLLFFCSFPPPNTGQTINTEVLYNVLSSSYITDKINIVDKNRHSRDSGKFSISVLFNIFWKYFLLIRKLAANKYDFVYVVFASTKFALIRDVIYTFIIKNFSNAKLMAQLHSGDYGDNFKSPLFKALFKYQLNKVDKLIFSGKSLNNLGNLIDAHKAEYIPNMVSPGIVASLDEINNKIESHKKREAINVFFISNMIAEKGFNDLITALELIWGQNKLNYILHLVGAWKSTESRAEVEERLKKELNSGRVKIYGPVYDRNRIKALFLTADAFVLPTYYAIEAQPVSIIEAFCFATPVISTFHASIPDMVTDNVNGFLVNIKSPDEIAEKLLELEPVRKWESLAISARKAYEENYRQEVILLKLFNLFS